MSSCVSDGAAQPASRLLINPIIGILLRNCQQWVLLRLNRGKIGKQITETYANMTDDAARRFGEYLRDLRAQRKQSVRGLAARAGIDSGTVTRLEQGSIHAPSPDTLKQLAEALNAPLADLFAMAQYVTANELPDLPAYLDTKFGHLPVETRVAMTQYCNEQASSYDLEQSQKGGIHESSRD